MKNARCNCLLFIPVCGVQRWNPKNGFCAWLLPSDRWAWSSKNGLKLRHIPEIELPSIHWAWEYDWHIDATIDGEYAGQEVIFRERSVGF